MKTIIVLLVSLTLMGCAAVLEMDGYSRVTTTDFTPYTKLGFLITPEKYLGDYESIGMIESTTFPSIKKKPDTYNKEKWEEVTSLDGRKYIISRVDQEIALKSIYEASINMGADALMNFKMEAVLMPNGTLTLMAIKVSGFAIKRK